MKTGNVPLFECEDFFIEYETGEIPWVKLFSKAGEKELSELEPGKRNRLFAAAMEIERIMLKLYNPAKINIASFGNYHPKVHLHVMARFEDDSFFPEPMWGQKQREGKQRDLQKEMFEHLLRLRLHKLFTAH